MVVQASVSERPKGQPQISLVTKVASLCLGVGSFFLWSFSDGGLLRMSPLQRNTLVIVDPLSTHRHHRRLQESDEAYQERLKKHLKEFERSEEASVIGPSSFPKPTDKGKTSPEDDIVVNLTPALGRHRPGKDAVILLAAEYPINVYAQFIESLVLTGYEGDIVLSVHEKDLERADIREYLGYYANGRGVVVYSPRQLCFTKENDETHSAHGGGRKCKLHEVYARKHENGTIQPLDDPRSPRTVQNIRYETYWVMSSAYEASSWIMLVDARDAVFQANPFEHVPRKTDPTGKSGLLYFYGENMDATRIGQSVQFNYKWIRNAYGDAVGHYLQHKPIICSGATLGEKVAIETYLRAMVAEGDETGTILMGSDQGFHNRLYYSNKLANADSIHAIVVFDQGTGIVNNLAAMRSKDLKEWGNGKLVVTTGSHYQVNNWDGTISPVVHQFDRFKELGRYFSRIKGKENLDRWMARVHQA